jgi:hypothetical protein
MYDRPVAHMGVPVYTIDPCCLLYQRVPEPVFLFLKISLITEAHLIYPHEKLHTLGN